MAEPILYLFLNLDQAKDLKHLLKYHENHALMYFQKAIKKMYEEDLLSHFKEIRCKGADTTRFNYFDFLHAHGSPLDSLFYSRLFWPEFVEIKEMVFLKETIEDDNGRNRLDWALEHYDGDKTKTEQSFNLTEIPYLFGKNVAETTAEEDLILTERLANMWRYRLQMIYPERKFTVRILSAEDTGDEIGIIFYTERVWINMLP